MMKAEAARCCDIQLEAFRDHRRHQDQDIYDAIAKSASRTRGELETAIASAANHVKAAARRETEEQVSLLSRDIFRSIDVPGHVDHATPEDMAGTGGEKYLHAYLLNGFKDAKVDGMLTNRAVE